jgi:hypothetical protein
VVAVLLVGCGSSAKPSVESVISSGQIDLEHAQLQPPRGYTITTNDKGALRLVTVNGSANAVVAAARGSSTGPRTEPSGSVSLPMTTEHSANSGESALVGLVFFRFVGRVSGQNAPLFWADLGTHS